MLIESGVRPARRGHWPLTSLVLHAALAAVAVALTMRHVELPDRPPARVERLTFAAPTSGVVERHSAATPPVRASATPIPHARVPAFSVMIRLPEPRWSEVPLSVPLATVDGGSSTPALRGGRGATPGVLNTSQVDRVARPLTLHQPDYPDVLRSASVSGEVVVRFVVDTLGWVEPGSIQVVRSSHERFSDAVRRWLGRMRYEPAEDAGSVVRQLVEQRVGFALQR